MPRHAAIVLSLLLGAALHIDWHLARPLHHRLSLAWPHHWVVTAAVFAIVACVIARAWPDRRWRLGIVVFVGAALIAQLVEPLLEHLMYEGRFGYDVEAERWAAFGRSILAGGIASVTALVLCAPKRGTRPAAPFVQS